jgi:hypothetical protein
MGWETKCEEPAQEFSEGLLIRRYTRERVGRLERWEIGDRDGDQFPFSVPGMRPLIWKGFATEMATVGFARLTIGGYSDSAVHFGGSLHAKRRDSTWENQGV